MVNLTFESDFIRIAIKFQSIFKKGVKNMLYLFQQFLAKNFTSKR